VSASPEDAELEAVVREIWAAAPSGNLEASLNAAARLILEAHRERDEARTHAGYEQWRAEFDALRAERDIAREHAAERLFSLNAARQDLDDTRCMLADSNQERAAAVARVRELEGKLSQAVAHGMDWGRARIAQLEAERVKATTGELCACGNPKGHTEALVAKITIDGCTVVCDPNRPTGPGAPMYTAISLAERKP
jgi:hypothetical protein